MSINKCLVIAAHPDDEVLEIAKDLKENGVFFGINLGHQCPPKPYLTLLVNDRVPWVIGSDAHCVEEIWDGVKPSFINLENRQKIGGKYEV